MATNWARVRRAATARVYAAIAKMRRHAARRGLTLKLMWTTRSTVAQQEEFRRLGLLRPAPIQAT
eukprot:5960926-Heterocapsa_arctica.AAC.1